MAKKSKPRRRAALRRRKAVTADTVFQRLRLIQLRLVDLNSHLELHRRQLPNESRIVFNLSVGHTPDRAHIHVNGELSVFGVPQGSKPDDPGVSKLVVQLRYQCVYEIVDAEVESVLEHAEAIVNAGALVMWPHIREVLQSTTARMGIPPIILPMFAIGAPIDAKGTVVSLDRRDK